MSNAMIGSLLFCPDCGNLLELFGAEKHATSKGTVTCPQCGRVQSTKDLEDIEIVTRSAPNAFQNDLKKKRSTIVTDAAGETEKATINEKCPKCGNEEMSFHTLQLRSADEGTTVFYECPNCAYKFSTNN